MLIFPSIIYSQNVPEIIANKKVAEQNYLPDFSCAGHHFGETIIPNITKKIVLATDHGVVPNDGLDDSKALKKSHKGSECY
ncbi:hypothetical protein [Lutibacter sp.]|uniref:hypothetical protein n=1 Tax=Lutibacter sp. TaxID=1925666 RepID=UPI0034A09E97